jgi:hypothetical protein
LQEFPVLLQFRSVDFCPGLNETSLGNGKFSALTLDRVYSKYCRVLLIVGVKVGSIVLSAGFNKHSDDDPEKPREFRHARTLASSGISSSG